MTRHGSYLLFAAILLTVAVTAGVARASATAGDPRKCTTVTPGGPTRHAYYCAKNASVAAVRTEMARRQSVARWFPAVYCDPIAGNTLRWKCLTVLGGDHWSVVVSFRATTEGWKQAVTVTKTR